MYNKADLISGKYLKGSLVAFKDDLAIIEVKESSNGETVTNYILFSLKSGRTCENYSKNRFPSDGEYYSNFNNALLNLFRLVVGKRSKKFLKDVFLTVMHKNNVYRLK